jgi:acyl transferase domain-containing protein/NAD(P)-dependent dehydrogenase (short-subunit alcohol dehydrogenase family)
MSEALLAWEREHPGALAQVAILFAGGLHDARSAAMVATLAAPLTRRGAQIGVLMGTAYILTEEAVRCGAIRGEFQQVALDCAATATLTTGPGHASRCAITPFVTAFHDARRQLQADGEPARRVRDRLDELTLGRLRMATKGLLRTGPAGELRLTPPEEQFAQGMYMIGQVAALHDRPLTLDELHRSVTTDAQARLVHYQRQSCKLPGSGAGPADIAIIGLGVWLPGATDARDYWRNLVQGVECLQEIPPERWDWRLYYDPDPTVRDRIYAKRGGFIAEQPFDAARYGLPPVALKSVDPLQLLTLEVVRQALEDSRIDLEQTDRERIAVVLGTSGGMGELGLAYATRADLLHRVGSVDEETLARLPEWTEDSFAGLLPNVAAGRVSNRFDFGGINCTVDAACASSLAAVYQAVNELRLGHSDLAIAGSVDTMQSPFMYLCFAKTRALSPQGQPRTFDEQADGIAIAEGVAAVVLKRLADAERDGDRVYAVIKGIAGSSDGRAKGLTAPRPAGQLRALRRAYQEAGYSPATVGLWEAHGTGTVAGDRAELETVTTLLSESSALPASSVIGSVKTLIGHTKAAAGVAGLIKAALALYYRVLPPHRGVDQPLPPLRDSACPLWICPDARPWLRERETLRRASVSAFGFGGTNFHAALEEYSGEGPGYTCAPVPDWPVELFVWRAADRAGLIAELERLHTALQTGAKPRLAELAAALAQALPEQGVTLAIVAGSLAELAQCLAQVKGEDRPAKGVYPPQSWTVGESPGRLAVLFPGQGSQYPGMLRELALALPEVAAVLEQADEGLHPLIPRLSALIYPPHRFTANAELAARTRLTRTEIAQPTLGAVEAGLWAWLKTLNLQPGLAAGHSYGEYVALHAAGVLDLATLLRLSEARGRFIVEAAADGELGTMLAAQADVASVKAALAGVAGVTLANDNAPRQCVLSGSAPTIEQARQALAAHDITTVSLSVAAAFHSPIVEPARARLAELLADLPFQSPTFTVYGNAAADPYPQEPAAIRDRLAAHLTEPVNFTGEIEAMYAAGARLFLEVGPRNVLTRLTRQILDGQPHQAVAVDDHGGGLNGLLQALAALLANGVRLNLTPLFAGRVADDLPRLDLLLEQSQPAPLPPQVYLLSGAGVRRSGELYAYGAKPPLNADDRPSSPIAFPVASPVVAPSTENFFMSDKPSGPPIAAAGAVDQAMAGYQETMRQFLQLQERVMLAYLAAGREESDEPAFQPAMLAPRTVPARPLPTGSGEMALQPPLSVAPPSPASIGAAPAVAQPEPLLASAVVQSGPPDLKILLLKIASERTGYPPDMLGLDQDIEADLGIDSIKRVEILGLFRRALPESTALMLQPHMEIIANLPTLQQILDAVAARLAADSGGATAREIARPFESTGTDVEVCAPLSRFIVRAHEEPLADAPARLEPGLYLLTADELGVADALSRKLRGAGVQPLLIAEELLGDVERLRHGLDAQWRGSAIRAVIHLLPLGRSPLAIDAPLTEWRERMALEVKSVFDLLQLVGAELRDGGRLLTVSGLGGWFGRDSASTSDSKSEEGFPGGAGLTGLVKTLNLEWNPDLYQPGFIGKALDFDSTDDPEQLAARVFQELALPGGRREVGYPGGMRTVFRTVPASLAPLPTPLRQPDEHWVVLATGGARGITAETLRELASFRPTLILLGRTPLPETESAATCALPDAAALRDFFIAQGQALRPAAIEQRIQALLRDREIRANLADFTAMGARVDYRVVDVRDEAALAALLDDLYQCYGRIDAVIHGAGVIEDGWLLDKSRKSIDRVIDTKVDSAFLLASHLRPDTLKFLAFFTSVAGRFGNRGQADYATANEILARLAWTLHARWDGQVKVAAIHWSPWDQTTHGVGMVTPEVRRQFAARGVHLVKALAGRQLLLNELLYGPVGEVELVAGDFPWEYEEARLTALPGSADPAVIADGSHALLYGACLTQLDAATWRFDKTVDLISDPYLDHHRLDGIPVLPFAVAMEYMTEAAAVLCPGMAGVALSDVQLLRGLSLQNREAAPLRITLWESADAPDAGQRRFTARLDDGAARPCYQATVTVGWSAEPMAVNRRSEALQPLPLSVTEVYQRWLFHGPLFQTLTGFVGYNEQGIVTTLRCSQASDFYPPTATAHWQFDPALIDGALQSILVWARLTRDVTPLPCRIGQIYCYGAAALPDVFQCRVAVLSQVGDALIRCHITLLDEQQRLRVEIQGFECTADRALNRLGGGWAGGLRCAGS